MMHAKFIWKSRAGYWITTALLNICIGYNMSLIIWIKNSFTTKYTIIIWNHMGAWTWSSGSWNRRYLIAALDELTSWFIQHSLGVSSVQVSAGRPVQLTKSVLRQFSSGKLGHCTKSDSMQCDRSISWVMNSPLTPSTSWIFEQHKRPLKNGNMWEVGHASPALGTVT